MRRSLALMMACGLPLIDAMTKENPTRMVAKTIRVIANGSSWSAIDLRSVIKSCDVIWFVNSQLYICVLFGPGSGVHVGVCANTNCAETRRVKEARTGKMVRKSSLRFMQISRFFVNAIVLFLRSIMFEECVEILCGCIFSCHCEERAATWQSLSEY